MVQIDLCKLRPGDVIFSRSPTWKSRAIACATASCFSHAMIVVYPDVWFETDGAGSGFNLVENVKCFTNDNKRRFILADLPYTEFDVLRPANSVKPCNILESIQNHIALHYPDLIDFLPLFILLQPFPKFAKGLVSLLSRQLDDTGGYCSQMVSQILKDVYGTSVGGADDHISPGSLRRRLLDAGIATKVNCTQSEIPPSLTQSDGLQKIYRSFLKVTSKLQNYQYPHDRVSFEFALSKTFLQLGINDEPKNYDIAAESIRKILTNQQFFILHDAGWQKNYS